MPKRVLDFDALWASDKLASCAEWAQSEYAWLYGLADPSGSFEITNLRVIWGRVAAIRKNLSLERLREIFDEFIARGLLFTWEENGKRYAHWTGSDLPGRLPRPSWRMRLEKLAPPVPSEALAAYSARFGGSKESIVAGARIAWPSGAGSDMAARGAGVECEPQAARFTHEREQAHAQDWDSGLDVDLDPEREIEKQVCPAQPIPVRIAEPAQTQAGHQQRGYRSAEESAPRDDLQEGAAEELLEIYEAECGELPAAGAMTAERRRRCTRWLAAGLTAEDFRAAVRQAAATPFLTGDSARGWQASFDWLIANRSNARKVLAGEYAAHGRGRAAKAMAQSRGPADLYTGAVPRSSDCGDRVNPAALERIRARQAQLALRNSQNGGASGAQDGRVEEAARFAAAAPDIAPKPVGFDARSRAAPAAAK